jgi:ABC-type cobalamin transport system permease subunit
VKPARLTRQRMSAVLALLCVLLLASLVVASLVGAVRVDLSRALRFDPADTDFVILFRARLPRVLLAAVVGGGLAAAGAAVQALFRNALASPDVIGVSGGASVGARAGRRRSFSPPPRSPARSARSARSSGSRRFTGVSTRTRCSSSASS